MVVSRRDVVMDPAPGRTAPVAGPAQAEGEVDVLVVRAEERVETADASQGLGRDRRRLLPLAPKTSSAGCVPPSSARLAVAALCRPADQRIGVAGRIDPPSGRIGPVPTARPTPTVGSEKGARPASIHPRLTSVSLLRSWMNSPRAAAMPGIGGRAEAAVSLEP